MQCEGGKERSVHTELLRSLSSHQAEQQGSGTTCFGVAKRFVIDHTLDVSFNGSGLIGLTCGAEQLE